MIQFQIWALMTNRKLTWGRNQHTTPLSAISSWNQLHDEVWSACAIYPNDQVENPLSNWILQRSDELFQGTADHVRISPPGCILRDAKTDQPDLDLVSELVPCGDLKEDLDFEGMEVDRSLDLGKNFEREKRRISLLLKMTGKGRRGSSFWWERVSRSDGRKRRGRRWGLHHVGRSKNEKAVDRPFRQSWEARIFFHNTFSFSLHLGYVT